MSKYRTPACSGNAGIECNDYECARCGWNPRVASRRSAKTRGKMNITEKNSTYGSVMKFVPNLWIREEIKNGRY